MKNFRCVPNLFAAISLASLLTPAAFASTFFTNQSAFESQAGALTQVTFTGLTDSAACQADPFDPGCFAFEGGAFSRAGLTFLSPAMTLNVIDPAFLGPGGPFSLFGVPVLADTSSVSEISVQLPAGTTNAGLQLAYSGLIQPATSATITLSDGSSQVFSLSGISPGFIGFGSPISITSFTLTGIGGGGFETPLVEFGAGTPVPEPRYTSLFVFTVLAGYFGRKSRLFPVRFSR